MTNNEFNDWAQLWSEVSPVAKAEPIYRLYYDDQGWPRFYSMEHCEGNYIDITAQQFAAADSHVRVVNGKLVKSSHASVTKLIPSLDSNDIACSTYSVTIVGNQTPYQHWKLKRYDQN
jgi:hypothetical protein